MAPPSASGEAVALAAAQLAQLKAASTALRAVCAATPSCAEAAAAPDAAAASGADWEGRLAEVNTVVGAAPSPRQLQPGSPAAAANAGATGRVLPLHQQELVEAVAGSAGNCVTFLPLGLGLRTVVDAVLCRAVDQSQGKHVVVVVDRPAHALSHAQRLRSELGLRTAVFCGGDFLYSFQRQFQSSRVLVFTAGLLLRLLKTGVYHLSQASMLVLMDAFTAVRNHPSNTLVREYWRTTEEGARPRVVAVLASQLPSKPRPFDRLRQNLRKLCHSLQAQLLLPHGAGLAQLEAQLHHDSIQLHSFLPSAPEERLASLLQQHLLGLWDVLHEFGLNHFGRLVQFTAAGAGGAAAAPAAAAGAGGTPGTPAALGPGGGTPTGAPGSGGGPASGGRLLARSSPLSARGSPLPESSPATPQPLSAREGGGGGGPISAAAAAAEQPDPMQHDWEQVELQVVHSLWHSNALPARGDHVREPDALALMMHVLDCVRALRLLLEQGPAACLAALPPALDTFASFLAEGIGGPPPFGGSVEPLKARILQVAADSPLLRWAMQPPAPPPPAAAEEVAAAEEEPPGEPLTPRAAEQQQQQQEQQQQQAEEGQPQEPPPPPASPAPSSASQRRRSFSSPGKLAGGGGPPVDDGPHAAAAARNSRAAALVQLLLELQVDAQLSGEPERRRVALVAGSQESAAALLRLLGEAQQLSAAEVRLLRDAPEPPSRSPSADQLAAAANGSASAAAEAAAAAAGGGPARLLDAAEAGAEPEVAAVADAAAGVAEGHYEELPAASAEGSSAAATGALVGAGLAVHILAAAELLELERRIGSYHSLVWYASEDVLHASSQELESAALSACHQLSGAAAAVAAAAERGEEGGGGGGVPLSAVSAAALSPDHSPRSGAGRLSCHVLATASQVLALGEVRRVDHSLKAAMQLVLLGDSAAEEKLTMLAHRSTAAALEPEARAVLEMLCCGLVGSAPAFAVMTASPAKPARGRGGGGEGEEEEAAAAAPAPMLYQTSVTLPAAYFPPERFHISGVSMPLEVFVGPPLPSEAAASNAAALLALLALHRLGIVVRYWPSRLLLAQHLLPRAMEGPASEPGSAGGGGGGDVPPAGGSPFGGAALLAAGALEEGGGGGMGAPGRQQQGLNPMNFFCPLCNVAATGHKAFDAHLRGFRHQRRIKQAQLLQQGQEVSAMLQGLLLEEPPLGPAVGGGGGAAALPGSGLPAVAIRRPDLALEDDGDYGSPAFTDRQFYSPEPTPFRCDVCGVYCTSQRLLEAHTRGRKHQRRVSGGGDSPAGRAASPKAQPLVTPYFCPTCGLYATSEEQLRMHMLGKRHSRMTTLHRQRGTALAGVAAGLSAAVGGAPWPDAAGAAPGGFSLQQQHHQQLMAAAAAAAAALSGGSGAAWVPSSSSGVRAGASSGDDRASGTGTGTTGLPGSGLSTPLSGTTAPGGGASSSSAGAGAWAEEAAAAALQGLLLDASGNQRIYRCDLCGVVTPSRRHYDYHLQGIKHTRRLLRAQGLDPGSASQPGTPASCGSPLAGSRSASPSGRSGRGRHSRHSSLDWAAGGGGGPGGALGGGGAGREPEPPPESLICSVCGIMATSAVNLEDHYKGRRHQKNLERQQAQQAAAAAAAAAAAGVPSVQFSPGGPLPRPPFDSSVPFPPPASGGGSSGGGGGGLQRATSGITLGADGLRLSGGVLLSAGSLPRLPSGDVLEGYPCVRIGDVLLPSSMDLRAFLEEMQHLEGDDDDSDLLPPISELHEHLPGLDDEEEEEEERRRRGGGGGGAGPLGPLGPFKPAGTSVGSLGGSYASRETPVPPAPLPGEQAWTYGGSSTTSPNSGTTSPVVGAGAGADQAPWPGGSGSGAAPPPVGGGGRLQASAAPFFGSPARPAAQASPGGGGGGYRSRPGSAGGGGHRLSRFAQDQQQAQQAAQAAQLAQLQASELGMGYAAAAAAAAAGQPYGYAALQPTAFGLVPLSPAAASAAYAAGYAPLQQAEAYAAAQAQAAALAQQAAVMQHMAYGGLPLSPVASPYAGLAAHPMSPMAAFGSLTPMAPLSPSQASAPPPAAYFPPGSPVVLARAQPAPPPPSPSGRRRTPPRPQQPQPQQQQQQQQQ